MRFRDHQRVGDILKLAARYREAGADELVFYDITASPNGRTVDRGWIHQVGALLDIPFCVAGGIRCIADAEAVLSAGAEKISINSPALAHPDLIDQLAARFGSQCVVVGIDSDTTQVNGLPHYRVHQYTGDPTRSRPSGRDTLSWIQEAIARGAGEIVLNCMRHDGVREGFDLPQLQAARALCTVPLVASGGAGSVRHFEDVFCNAHVDGALAASVFHSGEIDIPSLKQHLIHAGVEIRP